MADAVRAQHIFQEVLAVPRHSRRRFDPPPTAGGGADHRLSVGTGARWHHRGSTQDALGETPRTFLEREIDLQLSRSPILRYWAGTTDQYRQTNRLHRRMRMRAAQRALPQTRGTFPSAGLRVCSPRLLAQPTFGTRETMGYGGLEKSARALPMARYA